VAQVELAPNSRAIATLQGMVRWNLKTTQRLELHSWDGTSSSGGAFRLPAGSFRIRRSRNTDWCDGRLKPKVKARASGMRRTPRRSAAGGRDEAQSAAGGKLGF
jgi:hypothetical protein